ncbi:unnamed protein product [Pocillopora meandrina]|uniref:Uncharacterized protein n=1 Tax=Pocillopora meandrina TaxID=46732 RepID=A0AAU9VP47_9CNID|nr:unnamed protein product [Pocillopora meandrina]
MEDACEELDRLIVEFLESLECLQEKREYLNASIRDGHLNLSKAQQFKNAVVTFEMEKTLPRRAKGASKADYSEKKMRKT